MSITFYCKQRDGHPTFDHSYFNFMHVDPTFGGPLHEAFAPLVEYDFATISVTIEEDEDTEELFRLLDHYKLAIRPFVAPSPPTSLFDFNVGNQVHGWTEWYKFQYTAIMEPALKMQRRLYERGRIAILSSGGEGSSLAASKLTLLAKLTLIHWMSIGFLRCYCQ